MKTNYSQNNTVRNCSDSTGNINIPPSTASENIQHVANGDVDASEPHISDTSDSDLENDFSTTKGKDNFCEVKQDHSLHSISSQSENNVKLSGILLKL